MANQVGSQIQRDVLGPLAVGGQGEASLLIAGVFNRGPVNAPQQVTSMSRMRAIFGDRPAPIGSQTRYSAAYEVARIFFNKRGGNVYVLRIAGSGAETADVHLEDRQSTPEETLRVAGKGPGSWANEFDIKVESGTETDTVKLLVIDTRPTNDETVETHDNVDLTGAALERVNNRSAYIQLEDLGSSADAPDNLPATGTYNIGDDASLTVTAGADDNDPSDSTIVGSTASGSDPATGLKAFRSHAYGYGFITAPDLDGGTTVADELIEQSEDYYRIYLTSASEGADPSTAQSERSDYNAFNVGFYYPRPKVEDDYSGNIKTIPAVGHVVADWLDAIDTEGPGKAPAGSDFEVNFTRGLETYANGQPLVDETNADVLVGDGVNPIYDRDGTGPKVWGARTSFDSGDWQYLHGAFLWCRIASAVDAALDELTYENASADGFFAELREGVYQFMANLYRQDAFAGELPPKNETADPDVHAFDIAAEREMLSDQDKANGIVRIDIWFKEALTAETLIATVAKQLQ